MKLLRYGPKGQEKPGILDSVGNIRDLSGVFPDLSGAQTGDVMLAEIAALNLNDLPLV